MIQVFGLCLPRDAAMLGDLAGGLLVDHRTLQSRQCRVDLRNNVTSSGQVKRNVLDVALRQLHAIAVIQRVCVLQKLIHLTGIVPPLALPGPGD